jgi:rod shape-determining protein MreB and related proteins
VSIFNFLSNKVKKIASRFSVEAGVEFGTSNILIYVRDRGIVVNDPTMIARIRKKKYTGLSAPRVKNLKPVAYGARAKEMLDREPAQIEVISPVKNGIVSDLDAAEKLVAYYLKLIDDIPMGYPKFFKPRMLIGVPTNINSVQKRAIKSIFLSFGLKNVVLVEQAVLVSLALGLDLDQPSGLVIVDIGGGKTEVSVVSMGGVVVSEIINLGGKDFDQDIINFLKMKYGVLIGQNTAENIKEKMYETTIVRGRDLEQGLPKTIKVTKEEIMEATNLSLNKIISLTNKVLSETPPELMQDILKKGVFLTGRMANFYGLKEMVEKSIKMPVSLDKDAGLSVTIGLGELIENKDNLAKVKLVSKFN